MSHSMDMDKTRVAIVGMGTVGTGVARLLLDHGDRTARHAGRTLWLEKVVVRDPSKARGVDLPAGVLTTDLKQVLDDPRIEVVAQLIGGLEPARTIMLQLLEAGKDVVTANKALLAEYGPELFDRARDLGRSIAFEASVAGGIPIINALSQSLSANQIQSLRAILNGTSNFIVTSMEETQADFATAVAEAQRLGYAEADPTLDVDGSDAAQKLAILAHLAFGARVHWSEIPRQGIDGLESADLRYANQLGYRIKLIAVARLTDGGLELHVSPTLVRMFTPLAEVRGANNAISVVGDAVGRVFFHGPGAGQMPTASAVVADMIDTAVGRTRITFKTLQLWSDQEARVGMADPSRTESRFYLRLHVHDSPGVLSQVTGILGRHEISIASVIQHAPDPSDNDGSGPTVVPLIVMTHKAYEGATSAALREIQRLPSVRSNCVRMRVLD
ncbi:MAG TPA: homoserine dehydrogenase [Pirellulaceae bacterium]|nr:homoserine dehydrogenase [Pirellulaceae bacterium]